MYASRILSRVGTGQHDGHKSIEMKFSKGDLAIYILIRN